MGLLINLFVDLGEKNKESVHIVKETLYIFPNYASFFLSTAV